MILINNTMPLKNTKDINYDKKNNLNKILKRLIFNKDKNLKNIKDKNFRIFYFNGLINEIKNNNKKDDDGNEKEKDENQIKEEPNINEINTNNE